MPTVKDVLSKLSAKPVPKKADNPAALQHVWATVVSEAYEVYVPPFTMKQVGQLKHLAKACPLGKAHIVLEHTLRDWGMFVGQVKSSAGIKNVPSIPNLDFLLKHAGVAVTCWQDATAPKKTKQAPPKKPVPVQSIAKTVEPTHQKASIEEIMEIMNEDAGDE